MKGNKIKTVEVLQIAAGLAAALRWAIFRTHLTSSFAASFAKNDFA